VTGWNRLVTLFVFQVKRIVQGVLTKDSRESRENREALYYRRLTDRPKSEESKDGGKSQAASGSASAPGGPIGDNLESIAFGNKRLLPVFSTSNGGPPPTKRARRDSQDESDTPQGMLHDLYYQSKRYCPVPDVQKGGVQCISKTRAFLRDQNRTISFGLIALRPTCEPVSE